MKRKTLSYVICLIRFILIYSGFITILTLMGIGDVNPDVSSEGYFITPGPDLVDSPVALLLIPITTLISGIIAIIFFSKVFLRGYILLLGKKQKLGFVKVEEATGLGIYAL